MDVYGWMSLLAHVNLHVRVKYACICVHVHTYTSIHVCIYAHVGTQCVHVPTYARTCMYTYFMCYLL